MNSEGRLSDREYNPVLPGSSICGYFLKNPRQRGRLALQSEVAFAQLTFRKLLFQTKIFNYNLRFTLNRIIAKKEAYLGNVAPAFSDTANCDNGMR